MLHCFVLGSFLICCFLLQQVVDSPVRLPRTATSPFRATSPPGYSQKSWDDAPNPPSFELLSQDDPIPDTCAAEKPVEGMHFVLSIVLFKQHFLFLTYAHCVLYPGFIP